MCFCDHSFQGDSEKEDENGNTCHCNGCPKDGPNGNGFHAY